MPRSKNRRSAKKNIERRVVKNHGQSKKRSGKLLPKLNKITLWLAATGLLAFFSNLIFSYLTGDIEAKYIKPLGRGYEFQLTNKSSTDQVVEFLRAVPDKQEFVFKITKNIYGEFSADGSVSLPGGRISYMPAYEFKGMDGFVIPANSSTNFKLPPLSSRNYVAPESVVMFLEFKTSSADRFINKVEKLVEFIGIGGGKKKLKYLVSENYWTPISSISLVDATKVACRDDDTFSESSVCDKYK